MASSLENLVANVKQRNFLNLKKFYSDLQLKLQTRCLSIWLCWKSEIYFLKNTYNPNQSFIQNWRTDAFQMRITNIHRFWWMEEDDLINERVIKLWNQIITNRGYILEVDPYEKLYDLHNYYHPAPEKDESG